MAWAALAAAGGIIIEIGLFLTGIITALNSGGLRNGKAYVSENALNH